MERGWMGWLAWVGVAAAALYTQYFVGGSVLAIANAIALLAVLRAWRADGRFPARFAAGWVVAQVVVLALFAPWLALAWPAIRDWPALGPPVGAGFIAREGLATFALGTRPLPAAMPWLPAMFLLAAAGLLGRGRDGSRWASAIALTYAAIPLALMGVMSLTRPAWNAKFLIAGAPGFELLAGAGVVGIATGVAALIRAIPGNAGVPPARSRDRAARIVGIAVAGILLLLILWPRAQTLSAMYFDPAYQRDDYRGIAAQIAAEAGPEDAVILNAPTQVEVFDYYNRGRLPTYPLPLERPADRAATLARLEEIGRTHRDLYAVLWATDESDPEGIVEGWLNANRYKVFDEWHGNVRLALWAAEREPMTQRLAGLIAYFGRYSDDFEWLTLDDVKLSPTFIQPGGTLTSELTWQAKTQPHTDYVVFAHLLDAQGHLVMQRDMLPVGGTGRTSTWSAEGITDFMRAQEDLRSVTGIDERRWTWFASGVVDRIGLRIPADLAPGDYQLVIGLYDPTTGERLPVMLAGGATSDSFPLGMVRVAAP
jgi:mannosyltransferase